MKLSELFENCAYNIKYQEVGDGVNYAFVEEGTTLYIYFQGSSQISDWVRNFWIRKKPYKDMKIPYKVHGGFLSAWKQVEDIIIAKVTEQVKRVYKYYDMNGQEALACDSQYKWKQIIIVGYSHGGALSGLCHECVWFWRPDLRESGLEGFGFESPRFYAGLFVKKSLRERWDKYYVIRDNNDIVTHMPPWLFGFCHVGHMMKVHGDRKLVEKKLPCCVKDHFPQVVDDGLKKEEN